MIKAKILFIDLPGIDTSEIFEGPTKEAIEAEVRRMYPAAREIILRVLGETEKDLTEGDK
jgi:hypothetical protein